MMNKGADFGGRQFKSTYPKFIISYTKIEPKEVPVPVFNGNKISLRNAMFSFSVGSDELLSDASNHASTKGPIEVIIIKAAHISRSYFEKQYDEDKPSKPMCWSDDTRTGRPSSHVSDEARQAINCFECVER